VDVNDPCFGEGAVRSFQRDIDSDRRIKRLWNILSPPHWSALDPTLGHSNSFSWPEEEFPCPRIQMLSHYLRNVGEIGKIFKKSTYYIAPARFNDRIQIADAEPDIRLDLWEPSSQDILNFISVYNPPGSEIRVKGRININNAPWFVLAQLPWVSKRIDYYQPSLAEAIVAYRDKMAITSGPDYSGRSGNPGFENIGQLNNVFLDPHEFRMDYYMDGVDQRWYPDMTFDRRTKVDGVADDFEERDLIFARISDLVTVRSDVFTAYILVRLGRDGPQKRVIAILDRSDVSPIGGKVKLLKLYEVPDAR